MSKYNKQQLKAMARVVLQAKQQEPMRYEIFVITMATQSNIGRQIIDRKVIEYASY